MQRWVARINAYSVRERVLLLLCIIAVLVGLWQVFVEIPREQHREQIQLQREQVASDTRRQQAQRDALTSSQEEDGPTAEIEQLQQQLAQLDQSLASLSQGLVSAEQLPQILREVLVSTTELQLHRLRTLPVEELRLSVPASGGAADEDGPATGVFRHRVELEVSGDYFESLKFLRRLESLSWRFYWDQLNYEVEAYPRATMRLRVYTLSAEEGLLGV